MSRLPVPGDDSGTWGNILNDFLLVGHNSDGTLKLPDASTNTKGVVQLADDLAGSASAPRVVATHLNQPLPLDQGGTSASNRRDALNTLLPDQAGNGNRVLHTDGIDAAWVDVAEATPDASPTVKGKLRLSGDLAGDANTPTVVETHLNQPLPIGQGGTNANTANDAINNLLPSQDGNAGKVIQTDGANISWVTPQSFNPDDLQALIWMEVSP